MSRRRLFLVLGSLGAALVLGLLPVLLWVVAPGLARSRLEAVAEQRGLEITVRELHLGWSTTQLRGVSITARRDPDALHGHLEELELNAGLLGLATRGRSAVSRVAVRGARGFLNADASSVASLLDPTERPAADGGGTSGVRPALELRDVELTLADRHGHLARLEVDRISWTAERARAEIDRASLDPEAPLHSSLRQVVLEAVATDDGWLLERVHISAGHLYARRGSEAQPAVSSRLLAVGRRFAGDGHDAGTVEDDVPTAPLVEGGGGAAALRTLLFDGASAVLGSDRLHPEFELTTDRLAILAHEERAQEPLIDRVELLVRRRAAELELRGEGFAPRGGRLTWNFRVRPEVPAVEGRASFSRLPLALLVPALPDLPFHEPERTSVRGTFAFDHQGDGVIRLDGTFELAELAFASPRIAPWPVRGIQLTVEGGIDFDLVQRQLRFDRLDVTLGQARASLRGLVAYPAGSYRIDLRGELPQTRCDDAVGAIPPGLLAELDAFSFEGTLAGSISVRVDSRDLEATQLDIQLANRCRFVSVPGLADVRRFSGPFTHEVSEGQGRSFSILTGPGTENWSPMHRISPFLVHAVLGHEDGGFFRHRGFSVSAIRQALIRNLEEGRYVYGASTISMQLVKNVFLHREKTLARKVQEVLLTWWVETVLSKREMLELYLNVIEYGPGIYGIRNAAEHFFGITPAELSPAQSAYLATILPSPRRYYVNYEEGALRPSWRRRVARFLRTLRRFRRYDDAAYRSGLAELEQFRFRGPPFPYQGRTARLPFATAPLPYGSATPGGEAPDEDVEEEAAARFDAEDRW